MDELKINKPKLRRSNYWNVDRWILEADGDCYMRFSTWLEAWAYIWSSDALEK